MNTGTPPAVSHQGGAIDAAQLQGRVRALNLMGLLANWSSVQGDPARLGWVNELAGWEERERSRRSLERRLRSAHIGRFKPLADFDWGWPTQCDRAAVQDLMSLSFMLDATNVVLVGPNGVGKTMLLKNLARRALHAGQKFRQAYTGLPGRCHRAIGDGDQVLVSRWGGR